MTDVEEPLSAPVSDDGDMDKVPVFPNGTSSIDRDKLYWGQSYTKFTFIIIFVYNNINNIKSKIHKFIPVYRLARRRKSEPY